MLKLQILETLDELRDSEWDDLIAACPDSTIFQSHGWIRSWWTAYASPQRLLHLVAVRVDSQLVGLAPLFVESGSTDSRRIGYLGEGHADYQVYSARHGDPRAVNTILDHLAQQVEAGIAVDIREVPQFSTLGLCLQLRALANPRTLRRVSTTTCPRLQIAGNDHGVGQVLKKQSLRRHVKNLTARAPLHIVHTTDATRIHASLDALFAQHKRRWTDTPFPSLFHDSRACDFYRVMVDALGCQQNVILTTVTSGEDCVAMHLGLRSNQTFIWYKPTYEPDFAKYSPGEVLLKSLLELAQKDGYTAFDFTRGNEPFKARFASTFEYNENYQWLPTSPFQTCIRGVRRIRSWLARRLRTNGRAHMRHEESVERPPLCAISLQGNPSTPASRRKTVFSVAPAVILRHDAIGPASGSPEQLSRWVRDTHEAAGHGWIIPADEATAWELAKLSPNDPAQACLLSPSTENLRILSDPDRLVHAVTGFKTHPDSRGPEGQEFRAACVARFGRMTSCVVTTLDSEHADALMGARVAIAARSTLMALNWHGPVTIEYVVDQRGELTASTCSLNSSD